MRRSFRMRSSLPEDRLLYQLAIAEHVMHTRLDADLLQSRLTITGYSVLLLIWYMPGISASEIARKTLISQQAAARLTTRLIQIGYLKKVPNPTHRKILKHKLTEAGHAVLKQADGIVAKWERQARRQLGSQSVESFFQHLHVLRTVFEK